jgi:hypothetical protein
MVARVVPTKDMRQTLLYNEEKLEQQKALFLGAFNYWQEDAALTFDDKLHRFRNLSVLNERSRAQTIHLSLNFHPDDQLADKKMRQIAAEFMKQIDFADQPFLVYRHLDAGHPHMHVVTINIRPDGSRISNDQRSIPNLMRVCAALEDKHHLTPAGPADWQQRLHPESLRHPQRTEGAQSLTYGQTPTKTGIARVLNHVLDKYNYTSLDHLNAVLSMYHVRADRGSEQGIMYRNRGLYYRMIDDNGKKIGAPIKASSFEQRPILNYLEKKFRENRLKPRNELHVRVWIDWTLHGTTVTSLQEFNKDLSKDRIRLVNLPKLGFFYIDFADYSVHRDSDLGPTYTPVAILRRTGLDKALETYALQNISTLKPKDRSLLQRPEADPIEKQQLLLRLSPQHDQWAHARREQEQTLQQSLHPRQRLRM